MEFRIFLATVFAVISFILISIGFVLLIINFTDNTIIHIGLMLVYSIVWAYPIIKGLENN